MKPAALLLALALLPGCLVSRTTVNQPLREQVLATLEPGVSTSADAVAALGAPTEVVQLGLRSAYRYDHTQTKRAGLVLILVSFLDTQSRSDRAWLFFDEEGLLTHVGLTLEADEAEYDMPWEDR